MTVESRLAVLESGAREAKDERHEIMTVLTEVRNNQIAIKSAVKTLGIIGGAGATIVTIATATYQVVKSKAGIG